MATKLDRKREFAQVCGDDQGRVYEQDGKYFVASGDLWVDPKGKKIEPPAATPAPTPAPSDDQLSKQLGG